MTVSTNFLANEPQIMGVINITPDSFSDGGNLMSSGNPDLNKVIDFAATMVDQGADWLDVGGESTRPGAKPVSVSEEQQRVIPVIEALRSRFDTKISVDTSQPEVIKLAAQAGVSMVNDVRALQLDGALQAAADSQMAVCLMHMQGIPVSMQDKPKYESVSEIVKGFLLARIDAALSAGIEPERVCIDPGFGFGKSLSHNLQLIESITELSLLGYPVLVGFSRKSMIGNMTGREPSDREAGTMMLNTLALQKGASIFRVHEVSAAVDMIKIWNSIQSENTKNKLTD